MGSPVSIHVALRHVTQYQYDRAVELSPQLVRLRPAPHCRTPILSYSQRITPSGHFLNWQQDPQSNYVARVTFPEKVEELRVEVDLVAEMAVYNPFDFFLEPYAEHVPFSYDASELRELQPFLHATPLTPRLARYMEGVDRRRRRTIDFLVDVNRQLQQDISYVIRLDPGVQEVERTLELASGSCRDTTWLLVQMFRHLGLASRFVSGYLIQLVPDVKALDGPTGADRDFTDLHAWCEVYLPGAGWIGLDPTSGLLAGEGHIPLACTPEPTGAAPVSGGVEPCKVEFVHEMSVQRIAESPRVTKPYTDAQWGKILACGRAVDEDLAIGDVRLTMGGEPTFVSTTDRDADEWNIAALGPTKRARAADLLFRLKRRYGANGFVHMGQGKWYPGEQLPRWTLGCYWRADGHAAWTDPMPLRRRAASGRTRRDRRRALHHRPRLAAGCDCQARAGGLRRRMVLPLAGTEACRSTWTPSTPASTTKWSAIACAASSRKVWTPSSATPCRFGGWADRGGSWATGRWFLRDERLYLIPGDSPMGLRLPLDVSAVVGC